MTIPTEGKLLRIFIGEADHWHGKPLYEAIVDGGPDARARRRHGGQGIHGVRRTQPHSPAKLLELSQDLPIVIEIVDAPEKIEAFMRLSRRWSATA